MEQYYFLFVLALAWTTFAVIQDFKKREVANWLNFSLIAFAFSYRGFYSVITKNIDFFFIGLLGFLTFTILAYALYYARAFAGGDAKLLMGFGIILPYASYKAIIPTTLTFLLLLFLLGTIYSLIYSISIVSRNKKKFAKEFKKSLKKNNYLLAAIFILFILSIILGIFNSSVFIFSALLLIPLVYIYTKALDKCLLSLVPTNKLTEGDWIEGDIKIGKKTIKKSVHGLSFEEIKLLKKHKKSILIKEGIPFTPAFLSSLIAMVFFSLISRVPLLDFLLS